MHLSSQSLFLLLFVLVARVSLAADLETKDQTLIATPTHAPEVLNRYYARGDKSDNDGHQATIFDCTTKVIVEVQANGEKKNDAYTRKEVRCTPTAVFVPATPTASVATRSNKKVTVTVTAKATPTPHPSQNADSSSSAHKNNGKEEGSGSSQGKEQTPNNSDSTVSAFTESGPGSGTSTPTAGITDPNAPNGSSSDTSGSSDTSSSSSSGSSDDTSSDTEKSDDDTTTTPNDSDGSTSTTENGDDTTDDDTSTTSGVTGPDGSSAEGPTAQDPNTRSETQAVEGTVSNKSLGIGLGVGIGCVAAIGLAGLLVANKRRRETQSSTSSYNDDVDTHWRPQSFMGVVASVVAKLPRSASLRSNRTKRDTAGMAVGAGHGAIEDPSASLGRHPSNSSSRSAASQPPSLARVHEHPREQMHEIDLRY